jgi:hypothetical protein
MVDPNSDATARGMVNQPNLFASLAAASTASASRLSGILNAHAARTTAAPATGPPAAAPDATALFNALLASLNAGAPDPTGTGDSDGAGRRREMLTHPPSKLTHYGTYDGVVWQFEPAMSREPTFKRAEVYDGNGVKQNRLVLKVPEACSPPATLTECIPTVRALQKLIDIFCQRKLTQGGMLPSEREAFASAMNGLIDRQSPATPDELIISTVSTAFDRIIQHAASGRCKLDQPRTYDGIIADAHADIRHSSRQRDRSRSRSPPSRGGRPATRAAPRTGGSHAPARGDHNRGDTNRDRNRDPRPRAPDADRDRDRERDRNSRGPNLPNRYCREFARTGKCENVKGPGGGCHNPNTHRCYVPGCNSTNHGTEQHGR